MRYFDAAPKQARAGPSKVLAELQRQKNKGADIHAALHAVAMKRVQSSIMLSSARTYASHLRMILWASQVLEICPLPATLQSIRLVATCVSNASTLRGWLAAWRLAHVIAGRSWEGDSDATLKACRTGVLKTQPNSTVRQRINRKLARRLLVRAVNAGDFKWAACANFCFCLLLRIPSEFLGQFKQSLVVVDRRGLRYGPIHRKGKIENQHVRAFCTCAGDKFMCWHAWHPILRRLPAGGPSGMFTVRSFVARMR